MQRTFPWTTNVIAFRCAHNICTTEVLAIQHFFRCANLLSGAQFLLSRGFQLATCNETVVLLSGEGDDLRMLVNVSIGSDGDLPAFNRLKLDPLRVQLPLDRLPCVPACECHNSAVHGHDRALTFAPGWHALVKRSRLN
jgi:hypothetical protein